MNAPKVVYCIQKYLWNPDNTTHIGDMTSQQKLCIAYKSIFEILITQQGGIGKGFAWVVYCIQKYLWNPDNTTQECPYGSLVELCIAYKSIFEILITQLQVLQLWREWVVYCIQKYLWNPDNTTWCVAPAVCCCCVLHTKVSLKSW